MMLWFRMGVIALGLCLWHGAADSQQLAFPGAEGFGRFASGGRGGSVCKVTSLANSGAGTLRDCLERTGARTIVFTVGGIINAVNSEIGNNPPIGSNVTIACQTAPGDGVLIKGEIKFRQTMNIIMRYCRIRPGDVPDTTNAVTNAVLSHDATLGSVTATNYVIYDHISIGTANDDTHSLYSPGPQHTHFTIQHSIMSEGTVHNAVDSTSTFGVGAGGAPDAPDVGHHSWLHNLIISYSKRCPIVDSEFQFVNNICQWIGGEGMILNARYAPVKANIVNNSFRTTANNQTRINVNGCGSASWTGDLCTPSFEAASNIYVLGNIHSILRPSAASGSETAMVSVYAGATVMAGKVNSTTPNPGFPTIASQIPAADVRQYIIDHAGANYPKRDGFDTRAINDVINEPPTGRICGLFSTAESVCLANFNDTYASGTAPLDSDNDGMPNSYETANGLNPNSSADGAAIISGGPNDGYSNLEVYLNQIVGGRPRTRIRVPGVSRSWGKCRSASTATRLAPPPPRPRVMPALARQKRR